MNEVEGVYKRGERQEWGREEVAREGDFFGREKKELKCRGREKRGRREGLHFEGALQVRNDKQSRQVTLLLALRAHF